jgi:methylamine---glutamate N-methyltransferase subunit A
MEGLWCKPPQLRDELCTSSPLDKRCRRPTLGPVCGIAGLYTKTDALQSRLGALLSNMLEQLAIRGPDSAGVAFYHDPAPSGWCKVSLQSPAADPRWEDLARELEQEFDNASLTGVRATHAVFVVDADAEPVQKWLIATHPELTLMSAGASIEIFKEAGSPVDFIRRFALDQVTGSHALGHTRMATESRVTTEHSHPFSTGLDLCLVHNGSLSNHNRLRRVLQREGIGFQTDNDSEVAAGYLTWKLREGATLERALGGCMEDLDGFYTFAVGTADGFAVLRDPIACKPAVMAETDEWVAMASEYRAIAVLPGAQDAVTWEPEPGRVYSWGTATVA